MSRGDTWHVPTTLPELPPPVPLVDRLLDWVADACIWISDELNKDRHLPRINWLRREKKEVWFCERGCQPVVVWAYKRRGSWFVDYGNIGRKLKLEPDGTTSEDDGFFHWSIFTWKDI